VHFFKKILFPELRYLQHKVHGKFGEHGTFRSSHVEYKG
jgi:hypothetical protein